MLLEDTYLNLYYCKFSGNFLEVTISNKNYNYAFFPVNIEYFPLIMSSLANDL